MKNKVVLVTGGAGFIGSHVCKALKNAGYDPIAYDNLSNGFVDLVKWGKFVEGDIGDQEKLKKTLIENNVSSIIHMAAFIAAGESVNFPGKYYKNNSLGGLNIIESMVECGVENIVFSSTAAVYGNPLTETISEDHTKKPINPYGYSKLVVERMLEDFSVSNGIKNVCLRYFNAAGADVDGEAGCKHLVPNNLVPILMDVQLGKRDEIQVFGDDYNTPDGTCIRDYIHVADLADAHVKALKHLESGGENLKLNLGTGAGYSVMDVINMTSKVTGKKVLYKISQRRAGDPAVLVADSQKAKEILQWTPKNSDLETIISTAWNWAKK